MEVKLKNNLTKGLTQLLSEMVGLLFKSILPRFDLTCCLYLEATNTCHSKQLQDNAWSNFLALGAYGMNKFLFQFGISLTPVIIGFTVVRLKKKATKETLRVIPRLDFFVSNGTGFARRSAFANPLHRALNGGAPFDKITILACNSTSTKSLVFLRQYLRVVVPMN